MYLRQMYGTATYQTYGRWAKAVLRGKFIVIYAHIKKKKDIHKQPNFIATEKKKRKPKVSERKEIAQIRVEINE